MLDRLNPMEIIEAHIRTFGKENSAEINHGALMFQLGIALLLSLVHLFWFEVTEGVVSIVVSVASIIAGFLLNVMVLVYTLITGRLRISKSNVSMVERLGNETIANIAFCILCSIALVICSLFNLTSNVVISNIGHFFMCFFGVLVTLTILIILVNFYTLIKNSVK